MEQCLNVDSVGCEQRKPVMTGQEPTKLGRGSDAEQNSAETVRTRQNSTVLGSLINSYGNGVWRHLDAQQGRKLCLKTLVQRSYEQLRNAHVVDLCNDRFYPWQLGVSTAKTCGMFCVFCTCCVCL